MATDPARPLHHASLLNQLTRSFFLGVQEGRHRSTLAKSNRSKAAMQSALVTLIWAFFSTTAMGFPAVFELSTLDGTNGFTLNVGGNYGNMNINTIGDINGDGIDDIAIGVPFKDLPGIIQGGEVYVLFGKNSGFTSPINLTTLNGTDGFVVKGKTSFDEMGDSISSAGDINGDGINDMVIGDSHFDPGGRIDAGTSFVIFGKNTAFSAVVDVTLLNGTDGFAINGVGAQDLSGDSVAPAGDVNGDGIADLIIGADKADPGARVDAGASYVVFGKNTAFAATLELSTLNGTNGFAINGALAGDYAGDSVSSAGDVNGDGISDVIVGAYRASPGGRSVAGTSYVIFGKNTAFAAAVELSALNGTTGFAINGVGAGDFSGVSVSDAGDINNDGFADVIIGAYLADPTGRPDAGISYVVYGKNTAFTSVLELSTLNGTNGFAINGVTTNDLSGRSVSNIGDINSDGFSDILIGASNATPSGRSGAGISYVVFGKNTAFSSPFELSTLSGTNGFALNGVSTGDGTGFSVNNAGDIDSDGIADLLLTGSRQFSGHVIFGTPANSPPVAKNDAVSTNNNAVLNADVLANNGSGVDSDPDSDPLSVSKVNTLSSNVGGQITLASGALLTVNANGTFAYDPNGQFNALVPTASANDNFTYTISDGKGGTATATVFITINGTNHLPTGAVIISGLAKKGATLTADPSSIADVDGLGAYSYQWRRGGSNISGATGNTYTLVSADSGAAIDVVVSYTDGYGAAESVTSAATGAVQPNTPPTGAVIIVGSAVQDRTLTADPSTIADADGLGTYSYQWKRDGINITGATSNTFTPGQASVGSSLTVTVSYTDGFGTAESVTSAAIGPVSNINDPAAGVVTISGNATQGQTLNADPSGITDADGLTNTVFGYQWRRNGSVISGVTGNSYQLAQADVGTTIRVVVTFIDDGGFGESIVSSVFGPIANLNDDPTGAVVITGSPLVGATLTADTSAISDADGLGTFSYQWRRGTADISGAVMNTYLVDPADLGQTIDVVIKYTDGYGTEENLTSAPTETIQANGTTLFSSVLPSARSGFVGGGDITVFASVNNAGAIAAQNCVVRIPAGSPASLSYQETDATNVPVGAANAPFNLAVGQSRSFILSLTPNTVSPGADIFPDFVCDHANVDAIPGVNTIFLEIEEKEGADILSMGATPSGDGIMNVPSGGTGFMTISATNIGAGDNPGSADTAVTVSVDTGNASLPLFLLLCQTNALSTCITPLGSGDINTVIGDTPSYFAVFAADQSGGVGIPLDPANARIYLRFRNAKGTVSSVTSAAVTVDPAATAEAPMSNDLPVGRWAVSVRETIGNRHTQEPGTLYVWPDGRATLHNGKKTTALQLSITGTGHFTGFEDKGVLAGQYTPGHSLFMVDTGKHRRLDIWGVHDTRGLPQ